MNQQIDKFDDIYTVRMYGVNYGVMTSVHTVGSVDVESIDDAVQTVNRQGSMVVGTMSGQMADITYLITKVI